MLKNKVVDGFLKLSSMGQWGNSLSRYLGRSAFGVMDLAKVVRHDDPARLNKLREITEVGGRLIVDFLTDDEREVRVAAYWSLGLLGEPDALRPL